MIHLDTCFLVDLLREGRRGSNGRAHRLLQTLGSEPLAISIHVACELYAGAELSRAPADEGTRVAALCSAVEVVAVTDERFPQTYGNLMAELRRRGEAVSTMDLLIATAARVDNAALVTRNVRNFERIPELSVIAY